jgi:hypothetical protein
LTNFFRILKKQFKQTLFYMSNWPEEFKTFLVGMMIYFTITVLLSLVSTFLPSQFYLNYLESFGLVMLYVAFQSAYSIYHHSQD